MVNDSASALIKRRSSVAHGPEIEHKRKSLYEKAYAAPRHVMPRHSLSSAAMRDVRISEWNKSMSQSQSMKQMPVINQDIA